MTQISNQKLTKDQIAAAQEVLDKAITKKRLKLSDIAFQKDLKQITPALEKYNKEIKKLKEHYLILKKEIEKIPQLEVDENDFKINLIDIPKTVKEMNSYNCPIDIKNADSYGNNYGKYEPDMTKDIEEMNDFILNLKLGTALMSDLKTLLNKINNS